MSPLLSLLLAAAPLSNTSGSTQLTTREALSGIFGSVSLACWVFLLAPQLVENYRNGSAEAISLAFIFVWFLGDIANLAGALWAGLVPVVVAIGVYFCIADGVLISQCLYYGIVNRRREGKALLRAESGASRTAPDGEQSGAEQQDRRGEEEPLLSHTRTNSITIPGSRERRHSSAAQHDPLAKILEESDESGHRLWFKNVMSVLAIVVVGAAGWALAYESGAWKPSPTSTGSPDEEKMALGAQVLGYLSAVAYLGARIPQIIKNARERSCEGLSLLFFILSLMGNLTYGAGILCHSTDHAYIVKNTPWLIGSLGTMVEDVTIFAQFHMYRSRKGDAAVPEHAVI